MAEKHLKASSSKGGAANPDQPQLRTADLSKVAAQAAHLKAKYTQNAENYKRNTGRDMAFHTPALPQTPPSGAKAGE